MNLTADAWNGADPYEYFMGRWSSRMAGVFLDWLDIPAGKSWLDVGCGTGALGEKLMGQSSPAALTSVDPSQTFLTQAERRLAGRGNFVILKASFERAGLTGVDTTSLDILTKFESFEDYWQPFLGVQGPAPGYLASISEDMKSQLQENIYEMLPIESDGSIALTGRAFAIKGTVVK